MVSNRFPVIIGMGGVGPAGRTSFGHAFNWLVFDDLTNKQKFETLESLASLTGLGEHQKNGFVYQGKHITPSNLPADLIAQLKAQTLIRKLERKDSYLANKSYLLKSNEGRNVEYDNLLDLKLAKNSFNTSKSLKTLVKEADELLLLSKTNIAVNSGGQIPTGFDPGALYKSAQHPLALKMGIYGVSDALHSTGLDWQAIISKLNIEQVGVFASSMLGSMDSYGAGGYMQASLKGKRPTSKQLALSMPQMISDFINSYVIKSLGFTHASVGACATFLYNLYDAMQSIQSGRCKFAIVGASDAPLLPEIIDAYAAMKALATDEALLTLDGLSSEKTPNYQKACRPFGENCGFVLGESAQFFILCDDELAVEIGANVLGSVGGVFINADGNKKSISKPGPGNLFSMVQAVSLAKAMIGEQNLQDKTFVSAHGSGTPQNRVSESFLIDKTAQFFDIKNWPVCAVKSYVGHSTGPAAGDQLAFMLGTLASGIIPKINTVDKIANDVYSDRLAICLQNLNLGLGNLAGGFVNSKGFGGNNATAFILSAGATLDIIQQRYGKKKMNVFLNKQSKVINKASDNDGKISKKLLKPLYIIEQEDEEHDHSAKLKDGYFLYKGKKTKLITKNPYI